MRQKLPRKKQRGKKGRDYPRRSSSVEGEPVGGSAKSGLSEQRKLRTPEKEAFVPQRSVREYHVSTV